MKSVRQKINKIFFAGAALSLVVGFLFAPYFFADAGFFDKATDATDKEFGCDYDAGESNYTYAGENYCVSGCTADSDCASGEMCVVKKGTPIKKVDANGKTVTRIPAEGACAQISSIDSLCKTNEDCKAKTGKGFDTCAPVSPPQWPGNYFIDAKCAQGAKDPVGCCTQLSGGGIMSDITYVACLALGGDDPASISWQAGSCPTSAGPAAGACKADKDCLNNLICGGIDAAGNGKCITAGSIAAGGTCKKDEECTAGVCGQKDPKTGIGYCTVEGGIGGFAEFTKESCEKNGGEWVAGAGADGKGECYAKGTPISLSTEIGGKKQVKSIGDYLITVFNVAMAFGAGFAALMVMVGGFLYMTSGGDPNKTTIAKQYGIAAVTGLVLILFSYMLFNTINPALIKMKPITMPMVPPGGVACCKQGISLKMASGSKCESGWKEVPFVECQSGTTLGSACCVNKTEPGNSHACHAIGGICFPAEKMDKTGPCTAIMAAALAFPVVAIGSAGLVSSGAMATILSTTARAGWIILKWTAKGTLKVAAMCATNLGGCVVAVAGAATAYSLSELLAEGETCAEENVGVCVEAGPALKNGDMCKEDTQCGSGKCCPIIEAAACWGGGAIGFCSNGKAGPVSENGVGTCKLEDSLSSCCEANDDAGNKVVCAGAQVGSTMLGYCSAGLEGHACGKYTGSNFIAGYTYETDPGLCAAGFKCNSKGICTLMTGKSGTTVKCNSDTDCTNAQFCAIGKYFCKTDPKGFNSAIPNSSDFEGCIKGTVTDELTCYNKFATGHGCKDDNQCQYVCVPCAGCKEPDATICSAGIAGSSCKEDKHCADGFKCDTAVIGWGECIAK
ncbi:hypothetical protein HY932_02840 [Candidatus Falkowbacteria bacterium]|nr:hypothetical protein [Candidatus Falkowbacteria bacterium]